MRTILFHSKAKKIPTHWQFYPIMHALCFCSFLPPALRSNNKESKAGSAAPVKCLDLFDTYGTYPSRDMHLSDQASPEVLFTAVGILQLVPSVRHSRGMHPLMWGDHEGACAPGPRKSTHEGHELPPTGRLIITKAIAPPAGSLRREHALQPA